MADLFHRLDTRTQTIVFRIRHARLPEACYWGPRLADTENLQAVCDAQMLDVGGGMLDAIVPLTICPEGSSAFPGQPGMSVSQGNTRLLPVFRLLDVRQETGPVPGQEAAAGAAPTAPGG
ncbi:MAG: hypothetical protein Q4E06_11570 [Lautropia sp.]|nr:hypothetical protein [Lautropia sp.]